MISYISTSSIILNTVLPERLCELFNMINCDQINLFADGGRSFVDKIGETEV